jgi:hypothetical protein
MNAADLYRSKIREKPYALALPSGAMIKVILPPVQTWLAMGAVPPFYLKMISDQWSGGATVTPTYSTEEMLAVVKAFCELILAACVEPRVVEGTPEEGEISLLEMPSEDRDAIAAWCLAGGPGRGVSVGAGEVEAERLVRFPDGAEGGADAPAGSHGEDLRMSAERPS